MGLFDSFKKSKEEQKQKENPTTPPPVGHSLAEIMKDKKQSDLFGKFLGREGMNELAERVALRNLSEGDITLLEEQRKIFSEKIIKAEKIEKLLTQENVLEFARNNPDFEKVINSLTPERAIKAISSQLKEIAVSDEDRFNVVASLIEVKESYKSGDYKKNEERIEKLLEEKGITLQEYQEALMIADPVAKKEALKQLSYKTNGGFKRAINFLSVRKWGKDSTLKELNEAETSLKDSLEQLDIQNQSIGAALFMSVNENEDMRKAFSYELVGEKTPEEPRSGFKDFKTTTYNENIVDDGWELKKEQSHYDQLTPVQQENIRNTFKDEEKEAYILSNPGKSFWAQI